MKRTPKTLSWIILHLAVALLIGLEGCLPPDLAGEQVSAQAVEDTPTPQPEVSATPLPTRPAYSPGELVDYIAQTGDTLPAIAAHFNTTEPEIRAANTFIPADVTTMPPGMPMKIPIYYQALWGNPFQIIPDSVFINGPSQIGFEAVEFVNSQPGWLKDYHDYVADRERSGAEIVEYVSTNYSVSPQLLLSLLEYHLGALSDPQMPDGLAGYPLGEVDTSATTLYRQLAWAANTLNNAYYGWRLGQWNELNLPDGKLERIDPWQNAASAALHRYFSLHQTAQGYEQAISPDGFALTWTHLFGNPWSTPAHIPGSLRQPEFRLPFEPGKSWSFTGGPHNPWGDGEPFAALDFAPPSVVGGCTPSDEYATAVASGVIVRNGPGVAVLDLDGDGDERTGWVVFYLHLATRDIARVGQHLNASQAIGHPSCEGGEATGTHVHIARKYNGEWVPASGALPFTMEGWVASAGDAAYDGYLTRQGQTVVACDCSDQASQLQSEVP
jgi:LasA protease